MTLAKIILAGCMITAISSATLAEEARTGTVTVVDRLHGSVTIQQSQDGTVGANTGGVAEQFRIKSGMLDSVHAGDKVTFGVTEVGGAKTIIKIDVQ